MRFVLIALSVVAGPAAAQPALLPAPSRVVERAGVFPLSAAAIRVPPGDAGARNAARLLREFMGKTVGLSPPVGAKGAIRFVRVPGLPREGYRLEVGPKGATVTASDDSGLLYGAVTLWQLAELRGRDVVLPAISIEDSPRFAWRGLMLDSARHFQSTAFIKRLLDAMAASKLNTFHWHLVDDQGWRVPIPKYPKLIEVASSRRPATAPGAPPLPPVEGHYTADDIREIVACAKARGITVVPEIEMPGHALSAVMAYPRLGTGAPVPSGVESHWGVFPWLYNVEDGTFRFLEDVLDEVIRLFPSTFIHVGGDEAVKDQWRASPAVQARMRALGITDEAGLQSWFMARIGRHLQRRGRKLIGWDEILEGGLPPGATVMSWRGLDGALAAAKAGHDAVLSPAPLLYLDHRQGEDAAEGPGRGKLVTLADVYAFDPAPASLTAEQQRRILGLQGNLWTEHARGDARAAQMMFPRALAIAELGWSRAGSRDFAGFVRRVAPQAARLRALGVQGSTALFRPLATLAPQGKAASVALKAQAGLPVRYTIDGTAPDAASPLYAGPLTVPLNTRVRAASFLNGAALPGRLDVIADALSVRRRDDTQLALCSENIALRLEDDHPATGPRAAFLIDISNPCWLYRAAPLDGVGAVEVTVGQVPFNFQIGRDVEKIRFRPPATPAGEMEVRDGCEGPRIAVLPLGPAAGNPGLTTLRAGLPPLKGVRDLCFTYTATGVNPLWTIASVQLLPAP